MLGMDQLADIARRLENLLRLGTIVSVDYAAVRCRVKSGALLTASIPWITPRAGSARTWWAPSVGEQVMILSPGGDPARAVVLPSINTDTDARPAGADSSTVTAFDDGAVISYDPVAHELRATLPSGGKAYLAAPGGVAIDGDVAITGALHVSKDVTVDTKLTAATDVVGGGISLKSHKHPGVQSGGSLTQAPQ